MTDRPKDKPSGETYDNVPTAETRAGNRDQAEPMQDLNEQVDEASISGDMLETQETELGKVEPIADDFTPDAQEETMASEYQKDLKAREDAESMYNNDDDSTSDYD